MKPGDLVKFKGSGYIGLITEFTSYGGVLILISGDVDFKNPTSMGLNSLKRRAEVINEKRNPQS